MTPNKEDYLKCIYEISQDSQKINNKQIAAKMQVSAPAVSEMIKKMLAEDLIDKDKRHGYRLTKKGLPLVSELYRKHRLIEVFLVDYLHYAIDEIHQEAEVLEHTVSAAFVERLDRMLNYPRFCPHGGTIPKKGEQLKEIYHLPLKQVKQPGFYCVRRIHDDFLLLDYLAKHQLVLGQNIEITQIDDYAKTYTITYAEHELTLPENIAASLYVEKAAKLQK
ncbi:metal-dependent transcriptional regulator [Streptococcus sp. H49]|uniref:metal-dependent transcriptional regulator n=1 Tax=Streptococcus huangxiaojuni TaxID=3237239 RepID=UPI0034A5978A